MTTHMSRQEIEELKQDSFARKRWFEQRKKQQKLLYRNVLAKKRGAVALTDHPADDSREDDATIPPLAARCLFQMLLEHATRNDLDVRSLVRAACSCISARYVFGELSQEFVLSYSRNMHLCQREDDQACRQLQRVSQHEKVQAALVKYFAAWCPPERLCLATDALYRLYQGRAGMWNDKNVIPAVVMEQIHNALCRARYAQYLRVRGIPAL